MRRIKAIAGTLGCCAFPLLVHAGAARHEPRWTAAALAIAVASTLAASVGFAAAVFAAVAVAASALAIAAVTPVSVLYAPPVLLNLFLCAVFASTLRAGGEPLVTSFARLERGGDLPVDLERYTRTLTLLWIAFFALMAAVSVTLAVWGSVGAWSFFTNVLNYAFVALFFVAEYAYRKVRYRHYTHANPLELARRVRAHGFLRPGRG
jgi:uncharacterized membrane protein